MDIKEILTEWQQDCQKPDMDSLGNESLKTIKLHSKYLVYYTRERLKLAKLQNETLPKLKREKYQFYAYGRDETHPKHWEDPPGNRKLLKEERPIYIDGDEDVVKLNLQIAVQEEIVDLLKQILKEINDIRWAIKHAIDVKKIESGDG